MVIHTSVIKDNTYEEPKRKSCHTIFLYFTPLGGVLGRVSINGLPADQ